VIEMIIVIEIMIVIVIIIVIIVMGMMIKILLTDNVRCFLGRALQL
jgi:hypothetical protein